MPSDTVQRLIDRLGLVPHPEGGYFRESYRSPTTVQTPRGPRPASTAILYLLERHDCSRLHRIASDEVWHFYDGNPLKVIVFDEQSNNAGFVLSDENPQGVVTAGLWFGARSLIAEHDYSLVGCTVAPGFDFADFEMADRSALLKAFPRDRETIYKMTADPPESTHEETPKPFKQRQDDPDELF